MFSSALELKTTNIFLIINYSIEFGLYVELGGWSKPGYKGFHEQIMEWVMEGTGDWEQTTKASGYRG